jgi:hypothetical protein
MNGSGNTLDSMLDRVLAGTSGAAFALCFLAALVIWYRVLIYRPHMLKSATPAPRGKGVASPDVKAVIFSSGVAFLALSALFFMRGGGKLGWVRWSTFGSDLIFLAVDVAVILSALVSVRAATKAVCGNHALAIFGSVSAAVGLASYLWG